MCSGKIYEHTRLAQSNQTSTLETLHLIDTLHEVFPLDEIRAFFYGHEMRESRILFMGVETLSLREIFSENAQLAAALDAGRGLVEMAVDEIMAVSVEAGHFGEVLEVASARGREIEAHIASRGITCTTAAVLAVLLDTKDDVPVEGVDFERLEAVFCADCLIRYAMSHSSFRDSYTNFLAGSWRFDELMGVVGASFIPFGMFRPFSVFEAHELYLLYLKGKTIVDRDVLEVRNLVCEIRRLQRREDAGERAASGGAEQRHASRESESCAYLCLRRLCQLGESDADDTCRDLVGIVLKKRADNGLLAIRECVECMLVLEDAEDLVYGARRYRRLIVEQDISLPLAVQEVEDARAVLAFLASARENDALRDTHRVPVLDDYSWLDEDERAALLEAYRNAYPDRGLATLSEVCGLGDDGDVLETQSPLKFLLAVSRRGALDSDVVDSKIAAMTREERIELARQAPSLEHLAPWFCAREPTLNVSRESAVAFLAKVPDPIEALRAMREHTESLFSLVGAYDSLVLLPLISSILERGTASLEFITETQRYIIQTVLKDSFFAEESLVSIKRIVDLVLCADLDRRHRTAIERNCDEIIGLLKSYAAFFDKKIFVRNIK